MHRIRISIEFSDCKESVYKFLIEVDHLIFKFGAVMADYDSMQVVVADIAYITNYLNKGHNAF